MVRAYRLSLLLPLCFILLFVNKSALAQEASDDAIIERLSTTIVDADYDAVDLSKIVDDLRETHDLNIQVTWKLLESFGIRRDDRLEIHLKQVSLNTLLISILREAEQVSGVELDYLVDHGVILISTRSSLARNTVLRTYDITDLIDSGYADRRFFSTPALSLALTGNETLGGENAQVHRVQGGGWGGGGFGGGAPARSVNYFEAPEYASARMELIGEMIDMVITSVTPEDWEDNGGLIASIRSYRNTLLIRHTINGHARVQAFLDMMRQTQPRPLDGEAVIVRLRTDRARELRARFADTYPRVPANTWDQLSNELESATVLFHASTSGHNGSRLWFSALTQRDVLADIDGQVSDNANAFTPRTGYSTEGLELIALPLLSPDASSMQLDVQFAWIPPSNVSERDVTLLPGDIGSTIDLLERSMRTVSTQVTLSTGDGIILTVPAQLRTANQEQEWEDWLALRVQTTKDE